MRLIDAEPLYEKLMNFNVETTVNTSDTVEVRLKKIVDDVLEYYRKTIQEAPTVDAVPVVRCKDCIDHENFTNDGFLYCNRFDCTVKSNHFCERGLKDMEEQK